MTVFNPRPDAYRCLNGGNYHNSRGGYGDPDVAMSAAQHMAPVLAAEFKRWLAAVALEHDSLSWICGIVKQGKWAGEGVTVIALDGSSATLAVALRFVLPKLTLLIKDKHKVTKPRKYKEDASRFVLFVDDLVSSGSASRQAAMAVGRPLNMAMMVTGCKISERVTTYRPLPKGYACLSEVQYICNHENDGPYQERWTGQGWVTKIEMGQCVQPEPTPTQQYANWAAITSKAVEAELAKCERLATIDGRVYLPDTLLKVLQNDRLSAIAELINTGSVLQVLTSTD